MPVPFVIAEAGEDAARFTLEFVTAPIPNPHTRWAYGRAVATFCEWCAAKGVTLRSLSAPTVSAYLHGLLVSPASAKLAASALRHWLDFLTERGVLRANPALSERTARLVVKEGKTPVFERDQGAQAVRHARRGRPGRRRPGAARSRAVRDDARRLRPRRRGREDDVRDFDDDSEYASLVLHEKGGKERRIPCHHKTREYLRAYVLAAGFEPHAKVQLFQTAPGRRALLSGEPMSIKDAALPRSICNHSFHATGMTIHQKNGARLENTQALAGHADTRTTRLYIRQESKIAQADVETVQL